MHILTLLAASIAFAEPEEGDRTLERPKDEEVSPPPEVEPGSTREAHKVAEGETIEAIANAKGFLPAELRQWNDLPAGEPAPGSVIWLWVAPVAAAAQADPGKAADAAKPEKAAKAPKGEGKEGVGFFVGAQIGAAVSLAEFGPTYTPRLELGLELPPADRALRLWVSAQYVAPTAKGEVKDDRVGGSYSYEVLQQELSLAFGPAFRLSMLDSPVIPEVAVGPSVFLYKSTANGEAGGAAFPETTEQYARVGVYAQLGAAVPVGPGEVTLHAAFHGSGLNGEVSGEAGSMAISPLLGWRFVF